MKNVIEFPYWGAVIYTEHPAKAEMSMFFTQVTTHGLIHAFSHLRNTTTPRELFVRYAKHATREMLPWCVPPNLPYTRKCIDTPLGETAVFSPKRCITIIAILRAGILMADVFDEGLPGLCTIGHVGIQRVGAEAKPQVYCNKIPPLMQDDFVIIPDPMLATGGSICAAIKMAIAAGATEEKITTVHLVSAPEGVLRINREFPKVRVVVAAMDDGLNSRFYICGPGLFPELGGDGLGDFGDRAYGTEHR